MVESPGFESPRDQPDRDVRISDTSRVEAFSDAVFAIVITLLILDLKPPEHESNGLFHALLKQWSSYLAFLVSFVYIGVIWLNHHALFRLIRRMNISLQWTNLGILLATVIVPFPTAVLGDALAEGGTSHDQRVAVVLYALLAAVMSVPWWAVFTYLHRHLYLLQPGVTSAYLRTQRMRPLTGLGLYVVCGLGGWFISPIVGLVCIIVVIVYHAFTSEGIHEGAARHLFGPPRH
jgi:uncharacterized membrane protein